MVIKMTTLKLYDLDAYLSEFSATVVSCESRDNRYFVELDREYQDHVIARQEYSV